MPRGPTGNATDGNYSPADYASELVQQLQYPPNLPLTTLYHNQGRITEYLHTFKENMIARGTHMSKWHVILKQTSTESIMQ